MCHVNIKRVYEEPKKSDGKRILVDRLWPRGLRKTEVKIDLWLKEIAPSTALRKWFSHEPSKWEEFKKRYSVELEKKYEQISLLEREVKRGKSDAHLRCKGPGAQWGGCLKGIFGAQITRNNSHKFL